MKKKKEIYYQQRLKKNRKNKQTRKDIKIQIKK